MEQQHDATIIVGRPTMMALFDGRQAAQPILDALQAAGHPVDDVSVLLRPAGTDAVEDLITGERPAGQSGDARLLSEQGSKTLVLLHPDPAQVDAIRAALIKLGAENVEYAPETVYTGAQSEADFLGDAVALAHELHQTTEEDKARAAEASTKETKKSE